MGSSSVKQGILSIFGYINGLMILPINVVLLSGSRCLKKLKNQVVLLADVSDLHGCHFGI